MSKMSKSKAPFVLFFLAILFHVGGCEIVSPIEEDMHSNSSLDSLLIESASTDYLYDKIGSSLDSNSIVIQHGREPNFMTGNYDHNDNIASENFSFKTQMLKSVNINKISEGFVVVKAGNQILKPGIDYKINYAQGQVKIINEAHLQQEFPVPLSVSFK